MPDAARPVTILHLTDPHLKGDAGEPPAARLRAVLAGAAAMEPPPDFAVLTGDLADHGTPESYGVLRAALADAPLPVALTLGNHDDAAAFGAPASAVRVLAGVAVVTLDTHVPRATGGALAPDALAVLDAALAAHRGQRPVVIAMHHPPGQGDPAPWDALTDESTAALAARVAGGGVAAILCGHVHRDAVRLWQGVPVVTNIGLATAIDPTRRSVLHVTEGAGFALVTLDAGGVEVRFCALHPARAERARVPVAGLRGGAG